MGAGVCGSAWVIHQGAVSPEIFRGNQEGGGPKGGLELSWQGRRVGILGGTRAVAGRQAHKAVSAL